MKSKSIVIKMGGKAGQGILSAGEIFLQAIFKSGYHVFAWSEYPSLIRGGHNTLSVRLSNNLVYAPTQDVNLLLALDQASIDLHIDEIEPNGAVIYDSTILKQVLFQGNPTKKQPFYAYGVPISELSMSIAKSSLYVNSVALGCIYAVLGCDFKRLETEIILRFERKGEEVKYNNIKAAKLGYDYVYRHYDNVGEIPFEVPKKLGKRTIMSGNQALAVGAVKAGMKFTAAYPMTPASSIFDTIVKLAPKYNIAAKQAEDEISAICMTIGASYAGVRAMTMSAGGGFALMVEAVGLAGMSETPLVVIEAQRGGPSTGLPTKTEQSDLRFVLHASQGEFPRVLLAPGDVNEAFYEIQRAFNLAEMFQLPVFVLTDKYLSTVEMEFTDYDLHKIEINRGTIIQSRELSGLEEGIKYKRFLLTKDGVSPRVLPGTPSLSFKAGSDEHNELGELCEDPDNRIAMMDKRLKKEISMLPLLPLPKLYGPKIADVTLISWGSTKHICLEAIEILKERDITVNLLHFVYIHPLDIKAVTKIMTRIRKSIVIENNKTGQFAGYLTEKIGFLTDYKMLKYNGEPFYPKEIVDYVMKKLF